MFYKISFYEKNTLLDVQLTQVLSIFDIEIKAATLFTCNSAKEEIFIEVCLMYFNNCGVCRPKMKKGKFAFNKSAKVYRDFFTIDGKTYKVINNIEL